MNRQQLKNKENIEILSVFRSQTTMKVSNLTITIHMARLASVKFRRPALSKWRENSSSLCWNHRFESPVASFLNMLNASFLPFLLILSAHNRSVSRDSQELLFCTNVQAFLWQKWNKCSVSIILWFYTKYECIVQNDFFFVVQSFSDESTQNYEQRRIMVILGRWRLRNGWCYI